MAGPHRGHPALEKFVGSTAHRLMHESIVPVLLAVGVGIGTLWSSFRGSLRQGRRVQPLDDRGAEDRHPGLAAEPRAASEPLIRENVVACMLHAEDFGEVTSRPSSDDTIQLLRPVGRVHERDVVAVFIQCLSEDDGVSFEYARALLLSERGDVRLEGVERFCTVFHEIRQSGAPGKRLKPQCSGAREEIQHPRTIKVVLQTAEPAVSDVLCGRPNPLGRGGQVPTRVLSGDNAHDYEAEARPLAATPATSSTVARISPPTRKKTMIAPTPYLGFPKAVVMTP